jgi:O-antigen ligase
MRARLVAASAIATAWSSYSTLGVEYAVFAACLLAGLWHLHREGRWPILLKDLSLAPWAALWLLLLMSSAWTPAPAAAVVSHLWTYALVLLVPLAAACWTPEAARRALQHFVVASALVGAMNLAYKLGMLTSHPLWQRLVDAEGNQRIAISLLLALGGAMALNEAVSHGRGKPRLTLGWALTGALCIAGLAVQDRRSGMLVLPLLLGVLVFARQRSPGRRALLMATIVVFGVATWASSSSVRARFAEGIAELRAPVTAQTVSSSWGQRRYMLEITAGLVQERPLIGHGVGSWPTLWSQRTTPGTPLHAHTTPHNEYLMMATQVGAVGVLLLVLALAGSWRQAWRAGPAGTAALLAWTLLATSSLFNAMLRDAKFALPLLTLAALGVAATRHDTRRPVGPAVPTHRAG